MRIGHVIGRATMVIQQASFKGGRWLLVNPLDAAQFNDACKQRPALSAQPTVVVYDNLGAGEGDIIGFVEGAEATAPFDHPIPIDALNIAIFDSLSHHPF